MGLNIGKFESGGRGHSSGDPEQTQEVKEAEKGLGQWDNRALLLLRHSPLGISLLLWDT